MRRPDQRTVYFWIFVIALSALLVGHFLGWISLDAPYMGFRDGAYIPLR